MHQPILAKPGPGPVGKKPKCEPENKLLLSSRPAHVKTNKPLENELLPTQTVVSSTKGVPPQLPRTAPNDYIGIVKSSTGNTTSPSVPTSSLYSPKPSPRKLSAKCSDESSESANKVATQSETSYKSLDDNKNDTSVGIIDLTYNNKSCDNLQNADMNDKQENFTFAYLQSKFASACEKASKTITNCPVTSKPEKKDLSVWFVSERTHDHVRTPDHVIISEYQNILENDPHNCKIVYRSNESSAVEIIKDVRKGNFDKFVSHPTVTVANVITTSSNNCNDISISSSISSKCTHLTNEVTEDKTAINDSIFSSQKDKKMFKVKSVETKTLPLGSMILNFPTPAPRQLDDKARPKPTPRIGVATITVSEEKRFSGNGRNLFRSKSLDAIPLGSQRPKTEQTKIHSMSDFVDGFCGSNAESLPNLLIGSCETFSLDSSEHSLTLRPAKPKRHVLKARRSESDLIMLKSVDQINDSNIILPQQRQLFSDTVNTGNSHEGMNSLGNCNIHVEKSNSHEGMNSLGNCNIHVEKFNSCGKSYLNRPTRKAPTPPENLHVIKPEVLKTQNSDHKPNSVQESPSLDKPSLPLSFVQHDCEGIKQQSVIESHSHSHSRPQYINTIIETSSDSEVDDQEKISDKDDKKLFMIAKEVASSEHVFVDVLKLLNVDFRNHISCATTTLGHSVIPDSVMDRILEYLPELQNFNEELLKDLDDRIANWVEKKGIADVFVKKGPFLKLYSSYIRDFSMMTTLFDESLKKYPEFQQVCKEFEMSPRCASLALQHYMLKPVQRIPQYKLLLQDYMKHLPFNSPEMKDTQMAYAIVSEVANHANDSMKHEENVQKLMGIQKSITGDFEVIRPGRIFIKKGELMKLSRKEMQPRYFFLFNDVLLYTTPVATGYKLNNILPLTGVKVSVQTHAEYKQEFNIISTQRSFTIHGKSIEERDDWVCAISRAINDIANNRTTLEKVKNGLQAFLDKDFILGQKAPPWIPDDRVTMCKLCTLAFTVTRRRHHCRACGWVVCRNCSNNSLLLGYKSDKLQRVCDSCYNILHQDQPDEIVTGIRKDTKKLYVRPECLKEVPAYDEEVLMSGYLQKWVPGQRWKKYWFLIKNNVLYTFKATKDTAAKESMVLLGYEVQQFTECYEGVEPNLLFQLVHKNTPPIVFRSDSAAATMKWVDVILQSTVT